MARVGGAFGPVPGGVRVAFVVLTVLATALAGVAATRGAWLAVVVAGAYAVANVAILRATRPRRPPRASSGPAG